METRQLGRTGLKVTQLGFGAMEIRGPKVWGGREVSDPQAERILNAVLDAGINFIDTAPDYGLSEERIGRFISGRRKEYFLATKCGCDPKDVGDHWETPHTWTRDRLLRNIEQSLRAMKTDHVDLLQLHNPRDEGVNWEELVGTLRDIRSRGLTRFIGCSHTLPWLDKCVDLGAFDVFQIPYSCLEPEHHDAITRAAGSGAGIIIRGGIARGGPESALAGKERTDLFRAAKLEELLDGMTPAEIVLRYTLSHPHCHTTIVGTMNVDHLRENLAAAAKGPLPAGVAQEIRKRVAAAMPKT
jgi:aryl-alcohol dehydrogenase-like predicted oxidoreductase